MTTPLIGDVRVPGDKSVTQRVLLLGAVAAGTTRARGALQAGDTLSTAGLVTALGAQVAWETDDDGGTTLVVDGAPELKSVAAPLDCGNAGTAARLVLGLLAGRPGRWSLTGDASLRARPMGRVAQSLRDAGANIASAGDDRLPLSIIGVSLPPWTHDVALPSAQVKSALMLSGLAASGPVTVVQHVPTRDHTERLLPRFGVRVEREPGRVTVWPGPLQAADLEVPGDPSSAAFLIVAALLLPGSEVWLRQVGLWPRRTGALRTLQHAGADLMVMARGAGRSAVDTHGAASRAFPNEGDPCGDIRAAASDLQAFPIAPADVPDLVDEIPILALAAARARGTSRFTGLAELRLKESDRIAGIAALLKAHGVPVAITEDALEITGVPALSPPPANLAQHVDLSDHRLALTAAIAALITDTPFDVPASANVSYPGFAKVLQSLQS